MSIPASAICPAVRDVMETMYFIEPVYKGAGKPETPLLGASLRFAGALNGRFQVVVNREAAARLTAEFLVTDAALMNAGLTGAAVRELANVMCGAALHEWMPDADFHFEVPSLLGARETGKTFAHCFALGEEAMEIGFDLLLDTAQNGPGGSSFSSG